MNLANSSNTEELRALIAETAGISAETAAAVVAALHREGYGVVHASCAECRDIHESAPVVRAYHHPLCEKREAGACAWCGKSLGKPADLVGEVCARCAYGDGDGEC